jgi:DNA primase large subunit
MDLMNIFDSALDKKESGLGIIENEYNIFLYYILKSILAAYNNKLLDNHIANFYSKNYYEYLIKRGLNEIYKLALSMNIDCDITNLKDLCFYIKFYNYIPIASLIKDHYWDLVNKPLEKGNVYLSKKDFVRLLQEKIRLEVIPKRIEPVNNLMDILTEIEPIKMIFSLINKKMENMRTKINPEFNEIVSNKEYYFNEFPPCVKYLVEKATNGENLTHSERLHIAFFYSNLNISIEETIDVFRTIPDFDEKKTRYYIEYARGLNNGTKYHVYSCDKLRTFNLCKKDDKLFGNPICINGVFKKDGLKPIANPLEFVFWYKIKQKNNIK